MRGGRSVTLMVVCTFVGFTLGGHAQEQQQYVLTASGWGAAQTQAVADAGGVVVFSHGAAGIAVATSSSPDFLSRIRASSAITSADPDQVIQWQPPVGGDLEIDAISLGDDETFFNAQWAPKAIQAPGAWDLGCTGQGVRVAILDGGIHSTHVDLDGNLDVAASTSFVPGVAFNQDTGTFWHGTHVAGIVAAEDNAIGTIGIAPKATLIGVKVLHSGTGAFGWVIAGILYAATPLAENGGGADIINMSLGATFPRGGGNTGAGPLVAALNKAVNYANQHGVLIVSSAGNGGLDLDHTGSLITVPAQSGAGIAVSSTGPMGFAVGYPNGATNFDRPASYTNYGTSAINVAAPGGDFALPGTALCTIPRIPSGSITSFCWVFDMVLSTSRGAGASTTSYSWAAGTSMAAPAAAGVAALIKQKNPNISLDALKAALQDSAVDRGKLGADPYYGKGWVNALNACTY